MLNKDELFQPKKAIEIIEGRTGMGKTADVSDLYNYMANRERFIYIPRGFEISTVPPFYREKKRTIQVLGAESLCWDWGNRHLKGECTHRNCKSKVRFYASKPFGHVFFFDIDEKPDNIVKMIRTVEDIVFKHNFSHFILTETEKGYHIWICEIVKHKISFYELFMDLKKAFESDYEFHGQWILRLGEKQRKEPPKYLICGINRDVKYRCISKAHLSLLKRYAGLPERVIYKITKNLFPLETFARQVVYHSWRLKWW